MHESACMNVLHRRHRALQALSVWLICILFSLLLLTMGSIETMHGGPEHKKLAALIFYILVMQGCVSTQATRKLQRQVRMHARQSDAINKIDILLILIK